MCTLRSAQPCELNQCCSPAELTAPMPKERMNGSTISELKSGVIPLSGSLLVCCSSSFRVAHKEMQHGLGMRGCCRGLNNCQCYRPIFLIELQSHIDSTYLKVACLLLSCEASKAKQELPHERLSQSKLVPRPGIARLPGPELAWLWPLHSTGGHHIIQPNTLSYHVIAENTKDYHVM